MSASKDKSASKEAKSKAESDDLPVVDEAQEVKELPEAEPLPAAEPLPSAQPLPFNLPAKDLAIPTDLLGPDAPDDDDEYDKSPPPAAAAAPARTLPAAPPKPKFKTETLPAVEAEAEEEVVEEEAEAEEERPAKAESKPFVKAPGEDLLASVVVTDPEGNETVFALDKPVVSFGRDESSTICIPDKKCSRKHFVIEMAGDFYNAMDCGSTNGLKVNGKKVSKRRLRRGDVIILGNFKIAYHGPTDESEPDELADKPAAAKPPPAEAEEAVVEEAEAEEAPAAPPPAPGDDTKMCPECKIELPENAACTQCGYKSLRLRAQENFVDTIVRSKSLMGGLGLWKLKRPKALEQAFGLERVRWVLEPKCKKCSRKHRIINEFRVVCVKCEGCGEELVVQASEPPSLE